MMPAVKTKSMSSYLMLHFVVIIYGFTAILGKLITMPAERLVWYRMMIATVTLMLLAMTRTSPALAWRERLKVMGVGLIVAAHWITFFAAIKLSTVSVVLGCLASITLFTSLLEPLMFRKRPDAVEVIIGLLIIAGLYLIFQFEPDYWEGIACATLSSFLAALFSVINKGLVVRHSARTISTWEMAGGFLGITVYLAATGRATAALFHPGTMDLLYLLLLGTVCTAFAFIANVAVMKRLSAYAVALTINLEPVYGILLAFLIFGESELMSSGFYLGTLVILLSVFGYPIYAHRQGQRSAVE